MLKLKSSICTLCLPVALIVVMMTPAQASDSVEIITTDFSDLEAMYDWPKFDDEKTQLAEAIHARTYGLYPTSYYQKIFNEADNYSEVLKEENLEYTERVFLQCLIDGHQAERYKKYAKYVAYDYVRNTTVKEVRENLIMLNYSFIDKLALIVQKDDIGTLDTDFKNKLDSQSINSKYEEFFTDKKYYMTRGLANMAVEDEPVNSPFLAMYSTAIQYYCVKKGDPNAP